MQSPVLKGYLIIHLCVLLWGFTPIMGRLISLDAVSLVWWRMLLAALVLLLLPATWRGFKRLTQKRFLACLAIGALLSVSWMLFYWAIKLTNASVAAICLGAAPLFVTLVAPFWNKTPYQKQDLLLAAMILLGIVLVAGGIPDDMYFGLLIGLLAAGSLAAFSGFNKVLAKDTPALSATALQMGAGALFIAPILAFSLGAETSFTLPSARDFSLLMLLSVLMTAIPMALLLVALRHISVFAQQTAVNLEPLYTVILAVPLLGEAQELSMAFYLGAALIVGTVLLEPLRHYLKRPAFNL